MTRSAPQSSPPEGGDLAYFPITFFGSTMGIFGLALAMKAGGFDLLSTIVAGLGTILLIGFFAIYTSKALWHFPEVAAEWHHPVRLSFFPASAISVLLLSQLLQDMMPGLSAGLWMIAASVQAGLTIAIISVWISKRNFGPMMLSPAWFIPAVANVIVPLGGAHLGYTDICWYFFSVGLLFWIVLLTLVVNRLIFHDPLPERLQPTLVILIAPPSVGFLAWVQMNGGQVDGFAKFLYALALFFGALVVVQLPALLRLPFSMSFWALSFPLAALTSASFQHGALTGSQGYRVFGLLLLVVATITILVLLAQTLRAARAGQICQPERG